MTQQTPEIVAAGLTEAQRNAIFWLSEEWTDDRASDALVRVLWHEDVLFLRPSLIEYRKERPTDWRPVHFHRLTPLGLEVRRILQGANP